MSKDEVNNQYGIRSLTYVTDLQMYISLTLLQ